MSKNFFKYEGYHGSNQRLIVTRPDGDLRQQQWEFYYFSDRHVMVVDRYTRDTRKTKRHKWEADEGYYRLGRGHEYFRAIDEANVPLPDDVVAEVRAQFVEHFRVTRWSRRNAEQEKP